MAHAWWLLAYFVGSWLLTGIGPAAVGSNGTISLLEGMPLVAVFSLIVLGVALAASVPREQARQVLVEMMSLPLQPAP